MRPIRESLVLSLLLALAAGGVGGQEPGRTLQIARAAQPPELEDFVRGDTARPGGAVVGDFRQRDPGDGTPAGAPTTAYLSYDDANLYVVFVCRDRPALVRAGLAKREEIASDDGVSLYLATFGDRKHAYLFAANPLGVQADALVTEGQDDDYSFDAVWQADGRVTADGYVLRLAIPFRSLRFPRTPAQRWGIALARYIRRNNEESYWPYITKRLAGLVPQFGTLDGLTDISPGRNLQAIPYGAFTGARFLDTQVPAFRTASDRRLGLDMKGVIRDALTLDATVNPDFSQVESDEPQVTINERFETFFPEKRPFFIENAGYFQTPVNLFFSRRITDPGAGERVGSGELTQQIELVRRPRGPVVKIGPTFTTQFDWDRDGRLLDRSLEASLEVKLRGETKLVVAREQAFELFGDLPFDTYRTKFTLESEWLKWLAWTAQLKLGTDVNHKPPKGTDPSLGDAVQGELGFTLRPAPQF